MRNSKEASIIRAQTTAHAAVLESSESATFLRRTRLLFLNRALFLAAVVSLALVLRFLVVALVFPVTSANTPDHNAFGAEMGWTARSIAEGLGFSSPYLPVTGPTALVPPIYPYVIAAMFRVFGLYTPAAAFAVLGFNSICSALTCIPLFFLARHSLNERVARLAALAWAVYPFAIYFSASCVWDYALTSLLFTCCLLLVQRLHLYRTPAWIAFGALYGIATLSNPSITTLFPILLLFPLLKTWRVNGPALRRAALAVVAIVVVLTPWSVRNHRAMHASFFLRDGFWGEFYAGNNGDAHETNCAWAHPASNPAEMRRYQQLGEIGYIAEKRELSLAFAEHHPGFVAAATVHRIVRFWTGYWSFNPDYLRNEPLDLPNVPFCVFLLWAMCRGIRRMARENFFALLPYLCAVLLFPLPYYLTHSSMDYRQPLEPVIVVLVIVGLFGAGEQRPGRRRTSQAEWNTAAV